MIIPLQYKYLFNKKIKNNFTFFIYLVFKNDFLYRIKIDLTHSIILYWTRTLTTGNI